MKLCIDLCSGLGGFSQGFKKEGWEVVTIDILRKFRPSIIADARYLPLRKSLKPDVLLASPPCERFSVACHSFPKIGIKKAMELVGACLEAIAYLKPKHWLLENPMGRLRWFLGKPPTTIRLCDYGAPYKKLTDLWGNISLPMLKHQKQPTLYVYHESKMNAKKPRPVMNLKKEKLAKLPFQLSKTIVDTVDFYDSNPENKISTT